MEARKIIITGGATRIGAAIARKLSGPNIEILIHYNKSKLKAEKLKKELSNEKFSNLSFSNKEALLTRQSKNFSFDFANLIIFFISLSLLKSPLTK